MNEQALLAVSEYPLHESCVFKKVKEEFGGFSNMSNAYKVRVNGIQMHNTEALYQAFRFPHLINAQLEIIKPPSGMVSKMISKHYRSQTRADWDAVRIDIMRWCIWVKLAQNWVGFGNLLESTGDRAIVEHSHKDPFWGALLTGSGTLRGQNVLGKLLMALRDEYRHGSEESRQALRTVEPLAIEQFLLLGQPIASVSRDVRKAA
ncbi:NADAR family protein [Methylomicrobium sp. Wu6]|uniref:NADAR family protein n=1 Tax=Methylomicrobium sp. Wu6 TaxID=3107928 RepID=UPI002DD69359|nr:NADAR family protein [Methylomicrobium sp. Wu6]MEC4747526.1 NADAR family protein [Methylomicrobium sp. Wu6]